MIGPTEKPEGGRFYLELLIRIYRDAAHSCGLRSSSVERDILTLTDRYDHQGLSFLTKALPSLGKRFDKALGSDEPFGPCEGFQSSCKAPFFPLLFRELWDLVFDGGGLAIPPSERGTLRRVMAVRAVRQVCYLLYKLEGAHTKESENEVVAKFVATDSLLPEPDAEMRLSKGVESALENAQILIWYVLRDLNLKNITPSHGPGAVATGEKPHEKMYFKRLHEELEKEYPFTDYFFLNYSHLAECLEDLEKLTEVSESTAKVVLVPKDSRGPRLISMEPLELQWIQQGQMRSMVREIESRNALTCGFVNFTTQEINRRLALLSSRGDEEYVTLDMEEASDRVSLWLVRRLFPANIVKCLEASRSTHTILPSGDRIKLRKFAPMGSSVCFPTEALVFWALAVGSLINVVRWRDLEVLPPVFVFGDDIIMRKHDYSRVRPVFEAVNLRFNEGKCCTGRFFRESCGMDAYYGYQVTPIRVKVPWAERLSPVATMSYVSYYNSLRQHGYTSASDYIAEACSEVFGKLPTGKMLEQHPLLLVDPMAAECDLRKDLFNRFRTRYNAHLQRWEVRILGIHTPTFLAGTPDWGEMFRTLVKAGPPDPFGLRDGALRPGYYPVPHQIKMRWSWVAVEPLLS